MTNWEKEKARKARRAQMLAGEMEAAIESGDEGKFIDAYQKSFNCMNKKQRSPYLIKFFQSRSAARR